MNPATDWPALLRLALLGTRQSGGQAPVLPELPAPPEASAEARVLHAAAVLGLQRKAGLLPAPAAAPRPPAAPPETQPSLSRAATEALRQLLDGAYPDLLPDVLAQMAAQGRRAPHRLLVSLFDYASRHPELRPAVAPVLGTRGAWLAALNPDWAPLLAATATDAGSWEAGTPAQRRDYLAALLHRDPTAARALLAAALPQEPARHQAVLLAALASAPPAPTDEALLLPYLGSRSKEVRQAVAPLLARLPGSALAERLWQRAQAFISLKKPLLGRRKLDVTLPDAWDASWPAEGIEQKDGRFSGEKAAWLGQLLALLPPARWATHWQTDADTLLQLAAEGEWAGLLLPAWRDALRLHRAADWALAYLRLQLTHPGIPPLPPDDVATLLPPAALHQLLLAELPAQPRFTQPEAAWEPLLLAAPGPWPSALTARVLTALETTLSVPGGAPRYTLHYRLQQLLRHMQRAVPPEQLPQCRAVLEPLSATEPYFSNTFALLLDALHFRQHLATTLTEPPAPDG